MCSPQYLTRLIFFLVLLTTCNVVRGQEQFVADTIKRKIATTNNVTDKCYLLDNLSRVLMNVDLKQADSTGQELIRLAEESRDRKLMVFAYMSNAVRSSFFAGQKTYLDRTIGYYQKAMDVAKENKLQDELAAAELGLARAYLSVPDNAKALRYVNEAFSLISTLSNDSLLVAGHNTYGQVYLQSNQKVLALRNFLTALRIAEDIKAVSNEEKSRKANLMRSSYLLLCSFYADIGDYEKAIDYKMLAYKKMDEISERNMPYLRVVETRDIGSLYEAEKNNELAKYYYNRSIAMADSMHYPPLKMPGYVSLLNQYLRTDEPLGALDYFNSHAGTELKNYLVKFGFAGAIDQAYGVIYSGLGKYDSAWLYFEKAMPWIEHTTESTKISFYIQLAEFYKRTKQVDKAIEYLLKVKEIGEQSGSLEIIRSSAKNLDSLYALKGQYQLSDQYKGIYYIYKDSIDRLNKEKELTQIEVADEQRRQEKLQKEEADRLKRKNSIQYTAITIGIGIMFVLLVVLGMFKVSASTIRAISFFSFLILFEFIFLVFKKNIHSVTEGEPWKDLAFMIALAALLVPLHHWSEKRLIRFLTSHNRLTAAGGQIKSRLLGRSKRTDDEQA
jgi:tetratricopeptide (TPR) repeat protein